MFNPQNFFEFAKELKNVTSQYSEAKKRTIISRMYYASFLVIRDLLKSELQNTTVKPQFDALYTDTYIHGVVMEALQVSDIHTRNMLRNLRRKRNDADYRLKSKNWDREIEDVSRKTEELIVRRSSGLPAKFGQHLNTIQSIVEKWFTWKSKKYQ